jgi:hypothetical protein
MNSPPTCGDIAVGAGSGWQRETEFGRIIADAEQDGNRRSRDFALRKSSATHVSVGSMLLKKSFCTRNQNFFWLYTRLSCKDVGDLIA